MRLSKILFFLIMIFPFMEASAQQLDLKFDHITSENGLPQNTIHGIIKDKYGFMWFGTWSGLCRYDGYKFKIYNYDKSNPRSIINNRIHNIVKDKNEDLWILTFNDSIVVKYNYQRDDFDRIPVGKVPAKFLKSMSRFDHYRSVDVRYGGSQWKIDSASNTLIQTNLKTKASKVITSNPSGRWSLNDSYVADIYLDNQDIFWVGTYGNGINKANLNSKPFNYYNHDPQNNKSVIDDNINALFKDKRGNFWIGTRNKGLSVIRPGKSTIHMQHLLGNKRTIGSDQIRNIFCDSRGFVWVGHKDGLDGFSKDNYNDVKHFDALDLDGNAVYGICEDNKGDVWFATWRGIYKHITRTNSFIKLKPSQSLPLLRSRVIFQDHFGQIWVGTDGTGLYKFKEDDGAAEITLINRFDEKLGKNTISDNRIYSVFEDNDNKIWVGTGNGLDRYDPVSKTFRHFRVGPGGLLNSTISAILEDNHGQLWVSHKKGISQIDRTNFKIINYTPKDGLQSNEFVEGAAYKDKISGMLYFGGTSGYNSFQPGEIFPDTTSARIVLTELQVLNKSVEVGEKVNGRVILEQPLYLSNSIKLGYKDRSFAIEFAGLHYAAPEGNKYAYMLEGFDKEWIYIDASRRIASYSNLEPGNYLFKVKGANGDGIWNMQATKLKILVTPPFWGSIWAYIIYTLLLITAGYIYHFYTTKLARIRTKLSYELILHEKENELHRNKLDFFTNISHEIKTPLSLILAPIERLLKLPSSSLMSSQLSTMQSNGDRLLNLINQLLDFRRLETGNDILKIEDGDLAKLFSNITNSFIEAAELRGIQLRFLSTISNGLSRFDKDKIEKILYNLISNAIKFTNDGGSIDVRLKKSLFNGEEFIDFSVIDNGIGIPKEDLQEIFKPFKRGDAKFAKGTGLGLAYTKSLIEQYNGNIEVESLQSIAGANMTTFSVTLPWYNAVSENIFIEKSDDMLIYQNDSEEIELDSLDAKNGDHRSKILLVEDNVEMRQYLKDFLSEKYFVFEASNGVEGLLISAQQPLDLIISDIMMPEMDGLAFCKILKNDQNTSHIPVILLTARTLIELQLEGLGVGADDYITKPFNLSILYLKINNILQSKERLRERFKSTVIIEPSSFNPVTPDEKLLKRLLEYVEDNLSNPELNVDSISEHIFVSKTQLYRKTKALTGLTTVDLIRQIRLKRAQKLLTAKNFNINEITFMVGFTDANYFRKCFKTEFGISPSEYVRKQHHTE